MPFGITFTRIRCLARQVWGLAVLYMHILCVSVCSIYLLWICDGLGCLLLFFFEECRITLKCLNSYFSIWAKKVNFHEQYSPLKRYKILLLFFWTQWHLSIFTCNYLFLLCFGHFSSFFYNGIFVCIKTHMTMRNIYAVFSLILEIIYIKFSDFRSFWHLLVGCLFILCEYFWQKSHWKSVFINGFRFRFRSNWKCAMDA